MTDLLEYIGVEVSPGEERKMSELLADAREKVRKLRKSANRGSRKRNEAKYLQDMHSNDERRRRSISNRESISRRGSVLRRSDHSDNNSYRSSSYGGDRDYYNFNSKFVNR